MPTTEDALRLARSRHDRLFFRPHLGNAGDALIHEGFYDLARRIGLEYTQITGGRTHVPEAGPRDLIIMSGGGSLSSHWDFGAADLRALTAGRAPLLLLPQSLSGHEDALRTLRPRDILFVRDAYTLAYARSLNLDCVIHLDHDMALHVDPRRVLATGGWHLPRGVDELRRAVAFTQHRVQASRGRTLRAWRTDAEAARDPGLARRRDDLSRLADFGTMDETSIHRSARALLRVLSWYSAVETDRLHIGIGAALVGTPVRLHANDYHKIRGVVEHSLATDPHLRDFVTFVDERRASARADHPPAGPPLRRAEGQSEVHHHRQRGHQARAEKPQSTAG